MPDDIADPVQPDEGQGDVGQSDSPYSDYLNRIQDEDSRAVAEEGFKAFDAGTTKKFQEAAEYRKGWEPYQQIGVNQYDPQFVEQALSLAQLAQTNPQGFQQWFQQYAQQYGLEAAQQAVVEQDEYGYTDPNQQVEQMLAQRLSPFETQLQQISTHLQQQQEREAFGHAMQFVENQIKELEDKHGDQFDRNMVEKFLSSHIETDPQNAVANAWNDYQAFRNQLEKQVLQSKLNAPNPAASGGRPDGSPEAVTSFKQASEIALATLRNNRAA